MIRQDTESGKREAPDAVSLARLSMAELARELSGMHGVFAASSLDGEAEIKYTANVKRTRLVLDIFEDAHDTERCNTVKGNMLCNELNAASAPASIPWQGEIRYVIDMDKEEL